MLKLIWILIAGVLGYFWFDLAYPDAGRTADDHSTNPLPWKLVNLFFMFFLYTAYKRYCILWAGISGESALLRFYESVLVPFICMTLPLSFSWYNDGVGVVDKINNSMGTAIVVFSILYLVLSDMTRHARKCIGDEYRFGKEMENMMMLNSPARSRFDLIFHDIGYALLPFIIFYFF